MAKIAELFTGIVLGALAFAPPIFIIFLLTAGTGPGAAGAATAIAILLPILMGGTIIAAVVIQVMTTGYLLNRGAKLTATGVWLIYPVAFAFYGYVQLAAWSYSERELPVTVGEVRDVLYMNPEAYWGGFDIRQTCKNACLTILRGNVLDSIAVPLNNRFMVYRLERGEVCKEATKIDLQQTKKLASRGYFDECVTYVFTETYNYDIRIDFGREPKWPFGPCCAIADIYEYSESGPELVAHWEGSRKNKTAFSVSTIIAKLTDQTFDRQLRYRPSASVEEELALLERLHRQGAYLPSWRNTSEWIRHVIEKQARSEGVKKLRLSDSEIERLLRIAPDRKDETFEVRFWKFERYVDEDSLTRLKQKETNLNGRR